MADTSSASLAAVLESIDKLGHDYVMYHDREQQERLVLIVERFDDIDAMWPTFERLGGAKTRSSDSGYDMRLTTANHDGLQREIVIQVKTGSGKSGVANLLWRAASQESAIVARRFVASSAGEREADVVFGEAL